MLLKLRFVRNLILFIFFLFPIAGLSGRTV